MENEKGYIFTSAGLETPDEVIDFAMNSGIDLYHNESIDWVFDDVLSGKLQPSDFTIKDAPVDEQMNSDVIKWIKGEL